MTMLNEEDALIERAENAVCNNGISVKECLDIIDDGLCLIYMRERSVVDKDRHCISLALLSLLRTIEKDHDDDVEPGDVELVKAFPSKPKGEPR